MGITAWCDCGRELRVRDDAAGRTLACPDCGDPVEIPEARRPRQSSSRSKKRGRKKGRSSSQPNWILPAAGGGVALVAIVGIVIAMSGGEDVPEPAADGEVIADRSTTEVAEGSVAEADNPEAAGAPTRPSVARLNQLHFNWGMDEAEVLVEDVWRGTAITFAAHGGQFVALRPPRQQIAAQLDPSIAKRTRVEIYNIGNGKRIAAVGKRDEPGEFCALNHNATRWSILKRNASGYYAATLETTKARSNTVPATVRVTKESCFGYLDETRLVLAGLASSGDGFQVIDTATNEAGPVHHTEVGVTGLAIHPEGKLIAVVGSESLLAYDTTTGELTARFEAPDGAGGGFADFSADGTRLAAVVGKTGSGRTTLHVWDVKTGELTKSHRYDGVSVGPVRDEPFPFQWNPTGRQWLLGARHVAWVGPKRPEWSVEQPHYTSPGLRFFAPNRLVVLRSFQRQKMDLVRLRVPVETIVKSRELLQADPSDMLLYPGLRVRLDVQVGDVQMAAPTEVKRELTELLSGKLTANGFVIDESGKSVLTVTHSERPGDSMDVVTEVGGNPTGQSVSIPRMDTTVRWVAENGTLLWDYQRRDGKLSGGNISTTDPKALRDGHFNSRRADIARQFVPTHLSVDPEMPFRPLRTKP